MGEILRTLPDASDLRDIAGAAVVLVSLTVAGYVLAAVLFVAALAMAS